MAAKKSSGAGVAKNIVIFAVIIIGIWVAVKLAQALIQRLNLGGSSGAGDFGGGAGADYLGVPYPPNYAYQQNPLASLLNSLTGGKPSGGGGGAPSGLLGGGGSSSSSSGSLSLWDWLTNEQNPGYGPATSGPGSGDSNPLSETFSIPYEPYVNAPTGVFDFNGSETEDWGAPGNYLDTGAATGPDGGEGGGPDYSDGFSDYEDAFLNSD